MSTILDWVCVASVLVMAVIWVTFLVASILLERAYPSRWHKVKHK